MIAKEFCHSVSIIVGKKGFRFFRSFQRAFLFPFLFPSEVYKRMREQRKTANQVYYVRLYSLRIIKYTLSKTWFYILGFLRDHYTGFWLAAPSTECSLDTLVPLFCMIDTETLEQILAVFILRHTCCYYVNSDDMFRAGRSAGDI